VSFNIKNRIAELFSKRIFRDSFYYTIGAFLVKGINFFLVPVYTSYLSPSEYGILDLYLTFTNILTIFCSLGLSQLIFVEFYKIKGEERKKFFSIIFWGYALFGLVICVIGGVIFHFASEYFTKVALASMLSVVLSCAIAYVTFYQTNFFNYLRLAGRSKLFVYFSIITGVVNAGMNILFVVKGNMGYNGILLGNIIVLLVSVAFGFFVIKDKLDFKFRIDLKEFSGYTKIGIAFILSSLCQWLINGADRWIVLNALNTTELGIYALAFKFSSFVDPLIITPITYAYLPYIFKKYAENNYSEKLTKIGLLAFLIFVPIALLVPYLLPMVISNKDYYLAVRLIPFLIISYYFYFISQLAANVLVYFKKIKWLVQNIIISGISNIILNYILVRKMGIIGCAYAYLISNIIWAILNIYYRNMYLSSLRNEKSN
jgi:O-antigen/teichoic acid export membrane protein